MPGKKQLLKKIGRGDIEVSQEEIKRFLEWLSNSGTRELLLDGALAIHGAQIFKHWSGALYGPVALRLCQAPGGFGVSPSQVAGVAMLALLGLFSAGGPKPTLQTALGEITPKVQLIGPAKDVLKLPIPPEWTAAGFKNGLGAFKAWEAFFKP